MWMRRKALKNYYQVSLRTVDYILKDMRQDGRFNIIEGSIVLVDHKDFEYALRHRAELKD